eukprot:12304138-Ditylum_brightwellii.AAC.1
MALQTTTPAIRKQLSMLAKVGHFPLLAGRVQPPSCVPCAYGSMTRRPWKGKQTHTTHHNIKPAQHAGKCIAVNQMEPTVPGFVAQLNKISKTFQSGIPGP